jgi:hypothetical protein
MIRISGDRLKQSEVLAEVVKTIKDNLRHPVAASLFDFPIGKNYIHGEV